MPRLELGRCRITVDIEADLAAWLHTESKRLNQGQEIYVESALRDFRALIDGRRSAAARATPSDKAAP